MERIKSEILLPVSGRRIVVQEGDGYSDKILVQRSKSVFDALPDYLATLVVELEGVSGKVTRNDILDLLTPDEESVALECYKVNYGSKFEFTNSCGNCGTVGSHQYDIDKLVKKTPDSDVETSADPTISVVLPRTKHQVVIGLLNGHKELLLTEQILNGTFDPNQSTFLSIRTIDGSTSFSYEDIINLPLLDHKTIRAARRKLNFGYETNIATRCPNCGEKNVVNILVHKDFLFPLG
jgi:hypothetical protein